MTSTDAREWRTMEFISLFAGIGGFDLGLERAGMTCVQQVEIDPFCQKVLAKHWPEVPRHDDIRTYRPERGAAELVCGGFPCQPFSSASRGRRSGINDDRFLWPEMCRIVASVRPTWVIGENVTHIDGMALERVVSDLEALSYKVAPPFEIPACAVGFDHWRPRFWFLGHTNGDSQSERPLNGEVAELPRSRGKSGSLGKTHGLPSRMDRLRSLGNAVVPQIVEIIGRAILAAHQPSPPSPDKGE